MSQNNFDVILYVNYTDEYDEAVVVKESLKTPLLDHNDRPIRGTSLLSHEIDMIGAEEFFNLKDEPLPNGKWRIKGSISYSQDWEGDWDSDYHFDSIEPANRRARRALRRKNDQTQQVVPEN